MDRATTNLKVLSDLNLIEYSPPSQNFKTAQIRCGGQPSNIKNLKMI
jgi:hypothetical protein